MDLSNTFLLLSVFIGLVFSADPPQWPKSFMASGVLRLPYAEVNEPFTAYYDARTNKSRVDYYDGSVATIQIGWTVKNPKAYGQSYKIAPVFLKGKNDRKCFLVNGTSSAIVEPQSVLPDLTGFTNVGVGSVHGQSCDIWQLVNVIGKKTNTYTMWVTKDGSPVRYEMMGYDSLFGSHYDKYYVDYTGLSASTIDDSTFNPNRTDCGDFPGPGTSAHRVMANPMAEFMNRDDSENDASFEHFKKTHKKSYRDDKEHVKRKHQFRQNLRFINSHNRAGLTYSLGINHLADLSDGERAVMRGYQHSPVFDPTAKQFNKSRYDTRNVPDQLDWRYYGAVTPVKDQSACGSCWSFGTAEAVEGANVLKTGTLVRLSPQELMDCTWDEGNNGCDGGEDFRAYRWILEHGLATEDSYGPYLSQDGYCHYWNASSRVQISGYVNVTANDKEALQLAMFNHGPISVGIDASQKSFSFYANGVYYDKNCGNKPDDLDHAVLAVGYGTMKGNAFWIVKNSWSTYWGNNGYILMSQTDNNCGVETSPTFVLM